MEKLIVWDDDWADEFDIFGFEIISSKEYQEVILALEREVKNGNTTKKEYYFGTNEFMMYSPSDLLNTYKNAVTLTENQSKVLHSLFNKSEGQVFHRKVYNKYVYKKD